MIQNKHNQFIANSIKNYLSNIKNKETTALFVYFHNHLQKVPREPPKPCLISKIVCMTYFFLKGTSLLTC